MSDGVTVTCRLSPLSTLRADPKSVAPTRVPVVPLFVLFVVRKAPATVAVPLIEDVALLAALFADPPDTEPSVRNWRLHSL